MIIFYCYGYLRSDFEHVHTLVECMDSKLFNSVLSNPHVLYHLLPPVKDIGYKLQLATTISFPYSLLRRQQLDQEEFPA